LVKDNDIKSNSQSPVSQRFLTLKKLLMRMDVLNLQAQLEMALVLKSQKMVMN